MGYKARAALFRKVAEQFVKEKFRLAAILSYENAKSRYESIGEVDEAIDFIRYYANELELNKGFERRTRIQQSSAKVSTGFQGAPSGTEKIRIVLKPYGVFGVIAPFNFPVSISVGMSVGAMMSGTPLFSSPRHRQHDHAYRAQDLRDCFNEAGIPDGVFNFVTGPGT